MKTKIIYISGAEVFDMTDIRAAFDEVRTALNLGDDTVMFGVPVDATDAFGNAATDNDAPAAEIMDSDVAPETVTDTPHIPVAQPESEIIAQKKSRGRPKKTIVQAEPANAATNMTDEIADDVVSDDAAAVIPILSVLAAQTDTTDDITADAPDTTEPSTEQAPETVADAEIISDIQIDAELTTPDAPDDANTTVTIADMIVDDAPVAPIEKTLEQLLESMTPLGEDHIDDTVSTDITDEIPAAVKQPDETMTDADTDATLAQLATEFAENQDKIAATPKTEGHGKIGKLKNILPFKKTHREDTGLMGDLFGWAGIAANDEDFSIPGFFANATPRK